MCPPGSGAWSGPRPGPGIPGPRGPWATSGLKALTQGWSNG